jgi:hypothetical protein
MFEPTRVKYHLRAVLAQCRLRKSIDRSFEQQRYRASGLTLLTAAIVLWNTVYFDRTITTLNSNGGTTDPDLLRFLSPLGWEHINLIGDYNGPAPARSNPADTDHCVAPQILSVGYFTFSQAAPDHPCRRRRPA